MFASALPPVIFIDKFNVSGIEMRILEIVAGSYLIGRQSAEEHLDFHCRGLAAH
jgi:hypothetical protein